MMVHMTNHILQVVKTVLKQRAAVLAMQAAKKAEQEEGMTTKEGQTQA